MFLLKYARGALAQRLEQVTHSAKLCPGGESRRGKWDEFKEAPLG